MQREDADMGEGNRVLISQLGRLDLWIKVAGWKGRFFIFLSFPVISVHWGEQGGPALGSSESHLGNDSVEFAFRGRHGFHAREGTQGLARVNRHQNGLQP